MKIDDVARIGWEADALKKRMFLYGVGETPHIEIGVTPKTFHEIEAASSMDCAIYRRGTEWPPRLAGFPIKVIEQYNGAGAEGAWLMIQLDTEA